MQKESSLPEDLLEKIGAYINGKLDEAIAREFKKEIDASPVLKREVEFQQKLKTDYQAFAFEEMIRSIVAEEKDSD